MERAIIIAKGDVQRVGYRDFVERIARKLNITGFAENLKPYDVRIVAEGEKENLEKFIEKIKIKESPIFVEKVEVKFEEATNEFKYFKIRRGDWKEELGERFDVAGRILYEVRDGQKEMIGKQDQMIGKQDQMIGKQDQTLGKQDQMIEKQDQMREELGSKIDNLNENVVQRFDLVDEKYGKIAESIERILEEMKEERKEFRNSIEKLVGAILKSKV